MFHLAAYSTIAVTAVETDLQAVVDTIMPISNGHLVPQQSAELIFAAAMATNLTLARLQTPTLVQQTTPYIRGVMSGLVPTSPTQLATYLLSPLDLTKLEEIQVLGTQTAGVNQRITAILGLQYGPASPAYGNIYTIRGVSVTAAVANAWTTIAMVWQNALPNGRYAIVGMQHLSANGQAARLIVQGLFFRPGCLSSILVGDIPHPYFQKGAMGQWGVFDNYTMPNVEVLCNAANAAHEVYMDIIPL